MVARIVFLTPAQEARLSEHADRWREAGLATGPADRPRFEEAARRCYVHAGIPWHGNVVWMSSPLTLTLAVLLIQLRGEADDAAAHHLLQGSVRRSLGEPAWEEIEHALLQARVGCADQKQRRTGNHPRRLAPWAQASAVSGAIVNVVRDLPAREVARSAWPWGSVHARVHRAVTTAVNDVVQVALTPIGSAIDWAVDRAVWKLCEEADSTALLDVIVRKLAQILSLRPCILRGSLADFSAETRRVAMPLPHCAHVSFLREVCGLELKDGLWDKSHAYEQTMRTAGWWYPQLNFLLACERPREIHHEPGRWSPGALQLHNPAGPAISWPGGWSVYAVHGCEVPAWIIEQPQDITVADIEQMLNAEVRRVMIERYGWERYIKDCGAQVVDRVALDHPVRGLRGARLLRKDLPGEEPIVYLDMINSTPEPDGSTKHYLERIRPQAYDGDAARLCHAAMASRWFYRDEQGQLQPTFERWQDYLPDEES